MSKKVKNYTDDSFSQENFNGDNKYSETGESAFSRDLTVPYDLNEELSERNYGFETDEANEDDRIAFFNESVRPKGHYMLDEKILENASHSLFKSPEIDPTEIELQVEKGVVTLKGTVENRDVKRAAERAIEGLHGVVDIRNELTVRRSSDGLIQNTTGMI